MSPCPPFLSSQSFTQNTAISLPPRGPEFDASKAGCRMTCCVKKKNQNFTYLYDGQYDIVPFLLWLFCSNLPFAAQYL